MYWIKKLLTLINSPKKHIIFCEIPRWKYQCHHKIVMLWIFQNFVRNLYCRTNVWRTRKWAKFFWKNPPIPQTNFQCLLFFNGCSLSSCTENSYQKSPYIYIFNKKLTLKWESQNKEFWQFWNWGWNSFTPLW